MKTTVAGLALLLLAGGSLLAEYTFFTPEGSYAVEVSLDASPYQPRLPIYRNAISSLVVVGDYAIGGTSANPGLSPFLFAVSLSRKKLEVVFDLTQVITGQRSIQSGFGRGAGGVLYAGTMPDRAGEGGHLLQIRLRERSFEVVDLGIPVPGEGILAIAPGRSGETLYGISHPSGRFFARHLRSQQSQIFDQTVPAPRTLGFLRQYALKAEDYLCRRLVLDQTGRIYGSYPVNKVFRFDPTSNVLDTLEDELPEVWGRRPLGRVDAWATGPDGMLYGGNAGDGQLFKLNPHTGRVTNLGKPAMMPRVPGLAFGADGKLYGVTGGAPGYTHLFSYDPSAEGFRDLGNPRFTMTEPGIEQGIAWRGFQIATLAASEDGRWMVLGEHEALSQLMVFPVQTKK
ncbi:MAG: hypothetical protein AB1898_13045 [Acidobacteriota bacterium]